MRAPWDFPSFKAVPAGVPDANGKVPVTWTMEQNSQPVQSATPATPAAPVMTQQSAPFTQGVQSRSQPQPQSMMPPPSFISTQASVYQPQPQQPAYGVPAYSAPTTQNAQFGAMNTGALPYNGGAFIPQQPQQQQPQMVVQPAPSFIASSAQMMPQMRPQMPMQAYAQRPTTNVIIVGGGNAAQSGSLSQIPPIVLA